LAQLRAPMRWQQWSIHPAGTNPMCAWAASSHECVDHQTAPKNDLFLCKIAPNTLLRELGFITRGQQILDTPNSRKQVIMMYTQFQSSRDCTPPSFSQ
jgi:hypothetical protein